MRNNQFGLGGTDANGNDLMYDGNGSDNCFSLDGVNSTFPADRSTFAGCGGAERVQPVGPGRGCSRFTGENALNGWVKHAHPAEGGLHAARGVRVRGRALIAVLAGAALLSAVPAQGAAKKTVTLGDNYYAPTTLKVKRGTNGHVALARASTRAATSTTSSCAKAPRARRSSSSESASTDYTFKRKLTVPGTYRIVCTLHEEMRMTVKVRKAAWVIRPAP